MNPPESPTLSRGHKKRARTRLQLVDAGRRVLAEKGEALTVSDVVVEAGVSNGTFYNYFDDREQLFDALAGHLARELVDQADLEVDDDDPARRFAIITVRALSRAAADRTWGQLVLRLGTIAPGVGETPGRHLRNDLEQGRIRGRFAVGGDDATVDLVGGALTTAIRRIVTDGTTHTYVIDVIARLLCALGLDRDEASAVAADAVTEVGIDLP